MMLQTKDPGRVKKGSFRSEDGVLVEYCHIDNGKEATVAFVDGWGTTSYSEWYRQMRIKGYNLLLFNNRGNGGSGLGSGDYMRGCASDLRGLCGALGIKEVNLAGHSMGGLIETLFFTDFADGIRVRSMTFVSSPDGDPLATFPYRFLLPGKSGMDRLLSSFEDGLLGRLAGFASGNGALEKAAYLATRGGGVMMGARAFASLYHNFLSNREADVAALRSMISLGPAIGESMRLIDVPALIVHAKGDFFVSPKAAAVIHGRIAGSEMHIVSHVTHAPMIERSALFNEIFVRFLDSHNPAPGGRMGDAA